MQSNEVVQGIGEANKIAGLAGYGVPGVQPAVSGYNLATNWQNMGTEQRAVGTAGVASGVAQAAVATGAAELPGYMIPGLNVALAGYQSYKIGQQGYNKYYAGGTSNQKKGYTGALAAGGLMAFTGLGVISMANAFSGGKKGPEQRARDYFRKDWQKRSLADDDYKVALADGSIGDIGNAGPHAIRDTSKLVNGTDRKELKDYEIDYTNDMDYASGMAGTTLNRLLYGGRNKSVDDMGALTGNALLGSVGYGKDMTSQNFSTVMSNARGLYSKAGIKSKEDGLRLVALAAKQGRLTAADQAQAMQTLDMMYDQDGYKKGSALMSGRWAGINNMKNAPERAPTTSAGEQLAGAIGQVGLAIKPQSIAIRSIEQMKAQNLEKFKGMV